MRTGVLAFPFLGKAGRLGNQLWQIASGLGISHRRMEPIQFPFWDYRPYFSVPGEYFFLNPQGIDVSQFADHIAPQFRVYLQDYNLFSDIQDDVWKWFLPSEEAKLILKDHPFWDTKEPRVAIHVRRGDNARRSAEDQARWYPLPTDAYYTEALKRFPHHNRIVFSDDIDWVRENMASIFGEAHYFGGQTRPPSPEEYVNTPPMDWEDLFLMAACQGHIIANSTYSWWGAFLSQDVHPVYPQTWYGHELAAQINTSLMFPPGWVGVPC